MFLFAAEFFFHEHGLPKPHFCRTLVASWDKLGLGGESFKLNIKEDLIEFRVAQHRVWCFKGFSKNEEAEVKTTCREFNPLSGKI